MDIKGWFYLVVLFFAFALQSTNADTTIAAASEMEVTTVPAQAQGTAPAAPVTALIKNNTTVPIVVKEGTGPPPVTVNPKQNFESQRFPGYEITVQVPANSEVRLIKVYGQGSECGFPVCVMVQ